ncbi:unnamed protein product [Closterium sp. NIES-53]
MFQHIKDLVELDDSGPKAWKLLRDVIQPNTLPMVIVLEKELAALSMRPGNDVKSVLDKIKDTYARMVVAGSNVSQMQQCTKIISVLDNSWDNLIPTLNTQQDQWTPEWLRQQILQEDFRMRHTSGGAANKTAEGRPKGWAPPGMKPPSGERARGGAMQGSGAQGDGAHGKVDPGMFLMVEDVKGSEGDVGSIGKVVMHPLTHWVIDSGCTSHMTPRADLLDEVNPPGKIKFVAAASGALLPVIGVGNARVMGANRGLVELGNVLLLGKLLLWDLEEKSSCIKDLWQLPIIPWNGKLLATAAAAATAKATAGGEETAPSDGALDAVKKVQQPQQQHGEVLAGVDATAAWAKASSGSGEANWETWHERLCHVNFPMLQKLVKDGSLKRLEVKGAVKEIGSCPTFLETKFTKFPFSSGTGPAKAPLALVHMDVVGPTRAPSLSGSHYFLTIVDDHTRAVWVYPLKTKGEVAAAVLKEWMPRAQRESGHKVKVIRTNNGGEFIGADFEAVLKKKGIQHQLTVPHNPQQNGVAERFNRTLQEGARTLLGRAGLPDPFWVTALRQVALVKNRVLATVGDKQWVPYTKWYGSAPAVSMLRAYGCMVVFHVPKEKREKLEAFGRWGVHLGPAKDHKSWLIWDLTSQQLTVSRDLKQVQVTVLDEEISRVTEDGGEPEVEQQQQQQQDAPPRTQRQPYRPRRDVCPPNRLTYPSFGKPKVVRAGSVAEQCDENEIAHCYCAAVPEPKTLAEALSGPDAEKWKQSVKEEYDSLLENETWELCELPLGKKAIFDLQAQGWLIWDLTSQQLSVSRDVKFLESLYYKEWKQQQQKLPTTPLIIEADEVQRPSRQVQVTVSEEEISGVTEDGGEPEVEEQQQQQDAPQGAARPADRPRRDVRPPNRLTYPSFRKPKVVRAGSVAEQCDEEEIAHCYWAAVPEPKMLAEALSGPDAEKWKQSVKEEYDSLLENEMWELCELPPGKKAISSKLIFRHKYGPDGELTRYKSRLVAKGFQQTKGKDFDEIFAPVGKGTTLRAQEDHLWPEAGSSRMVPQAGGDTAGWGFKKSECDHSLFLLQEKEQFLMLLVYVDDFLLFSESSAMIERVEEMLEMQFKCSKMGDVKYYLGMHVERDLDKGVLRLHRKKYCEGLAEKYGLQDGGKPAIPLPSGFTVEPCADEEVVGESDRKLFHSMVGALNYPANHTRPDIAFATSRLASVVSRPNHEQLEAAKRLVRYVSAITYVGLEYSAVRQRQQRGAADSGKGEMLLTSYTDTSFNSVKADGTSIGGCVCLFGGGVVSWRRKKQNEVGLSSCKTEYMALHHGVKIGG